MNKIYKPEILAPAGSMDSLIAAIRCGADAIYLGSKAFSARQNASNFDKEELKTAVELAHKSNIKIYQTLNTVIFDDQINDLINEIEYACKVGIDAFIVQDLGVSQIIKQCAPFMPIHASTQMSIHTVEGVTYAKNCGFSRVVVSREMSENNLREVCKLGVEIEAFVHGALCMSVSGQCFMSAMIGSRSANRGLCAQACRLPFSAIQNENRCDLSLKDMSFINHIKALSEMGVASLKIEGRMKRPEYVAAAVSACRAALDGKEFDMSLLRAVFSRSGFTDGYFTGNKGRDMFGVRQKEDVISANDAFAKLHELYRAENKVSDISFDAEILKDKPSKLTATDSEGNCGTVFGEIPQKAINKPTDKAQLEKQLSKLGSTIYNYKSTAVHIDDGLILSASAINDLRRKAIIELDSKRISAYTPYYDFERNIPLIKGFKSSDNFKIRVQCERYSQLENVDINDVQYVIMPLTEWKKAIDIKSKVILSLPRYTEFEEDVIGELRKAIQNGFTDIECTNVSHIEIAKSFSLKMHGGFGLNICNSYSLEYLRKDSLCDATVSFELMLKQITSLSKNIPIGIIAYGKLPLMLTANCPIKQAIGCKNCNKTLYDRTGRKFTVNCEDDAVEILNAETLYLADKLDDLKNIDFITLKFTDESPEKVKSILDDYRNRSNHKPSELTRGLYYRGII